MNSQEMINLTADEARLMTDQIRGRGAELIQLIIRAYQMRIWEPLGYSTWDEYKQAELPDIPLALPPADRLAALVELRNAGLTMRAIASVTDLGKSQIAETLSGVRNRTADSALLPTHITGLDGKVYPSSATQVLDVQSRRVQVKRLNDEGVKQVEIAERLGVSQGTVSGDLRWWDTTAEHMSDEVRQEIQKDVLTGVVADPERLLDLANRYPVRTFVPLVTQVIEQIETHLEAIEDRGFYHDEWVGETSDQVEALDLWLRNAGKFMFRMLRQIGLAAANETENAEALVVFWTDLKQALTQIETIPELGAA